MNAITPMNAFYTPILKLIFFILGHVKPLQADLIHLSFIHFARWVVVKRHEFPRRCGYQPEEHRHYDYLLFFSNFNGTWMKERWIRSACRGLTWPRMKKMSLR